MSAIYVNWDGATVKLNWKQSSELPKCELITSVHGFCFWKGQLCIVDLKDRGWDFPGGHMECGESPEDCFKREAMEEAYVKGECELLGFITVDHSENQKWSSDSPYPKVGFQVFYKMTITKLLPFAAEFESARRLLIPVEEVSSYYENWHEVYQQILDSSQLKDS